jgi:hypothetical protein
MPMPMPMPSTRPVQPGCDHEFGDGEAGCLKCGWPPLPYCLRCGRPRWQYGNDKHCGSLSRGFLAPHDWSDD